MKNIAAISLFAYLASAAALAWADTQLDADAPAADAHHDAQAPVLSRKKRGVGPVVDMPCEEGYKLVGDDCTMANIAFE